MIEFLFESPFPVGRKHLRHLVYGDHERILLCKTKADFLALSEDDKYIVARFSVIGEQVSVLLHNKLKAAAEYSYIRFNDYRHVG